LHDEAGPCLFSIRAAVTALQGAIAQRVLDRDRVGHLSSVIDRSSATLQLLFRGLLERLRPKGLAELGLESALRSLFATWELTHPEVALRLVLPHDLSSLDENTSFTAYRIVQEGVTNIFRHANADWGEVKLSFALAPFNSTEDSDQDSVPQLEVTIEDNGVGIPDKPKTGMGLLGMRERVHALGGAFEVMKRSAEGTLVRALIPLAEDEDEES
jgi:two-component system sensor histidine kinase UhpB